MTPKYFLIAIAYAPPGNASNVLYSNGSTFGTTSSTSKLFGNGLQVGVTGNVILSNTYQTTVTSGTSLQVSKTQANSQQVFSSADALNHMNDEFYIWVHPQFNYSQAWAGAPVDISFVSSSVQTLDPLILNAAELTGQEVIPPQKMAQLLDLTPQDLAQIATQDPFLAPGYQLDPDRFRHVDQVQLVGPDHAGDAAPEMPYSVSDTSLSCQTSTKSWSDTLSVGFSAGADFLGQGEKVQIVGSLTWGGTGSTGNCNGSTQTATFTPHSTTVGFNSVVDVYEDSVYHTFAFTEPTFVQVHVPPAVFSTLKNSAGAPLPHKLITVTFANGSHRRLYTDANGNFTVISPPPGTVTIKSDEGTQKATIRVGANTLPPVILKKPAAKVRHD